VQDQLNETGLLSAISRNWGIAFARLRKDLCLAGSPERTAWRSVVETTDQRLFVLERIPSKSYGGKRRIAALLQQLSDRGLQQVIAYLPDAGGEFIHLINHGLWQLCPYVGGVVLERPAYAMDGWRGVAVADFLTRFIVASRQSPMAWEPSPFSIATFTLDLFTTLSGRNPDVADRYRPFVAHLKKHLFPVVEGLPPGFCHGDVHPINIIWGERSIRAVIDWEFCGIKPEIYDLANLLGCLGMEDPQSLGGPFVHRLVGRLRRSQIFSDESWDALPDLMLAVRFAWLSEWMRNNDRPMIRLEADYMALLVEHRKDLKAMFFRAA
jgi:homoserine kinase type II